MNKFIRISSGDTAATTPRRHSLPVPPSAIRAAGLALAMLAAGLATTFADYQVNISVKVVRATDGTRPSGGMAEAANFAGEIAHGNQALFLTFTGYRLVVVEFVDIQPPVPAGQPADYWYSLPARSNKYTFQAAALADPTTWQWRTDAINFYVNNSSSGQCSFPPESAVISLGKSIGPGTVIHEIGHIFGLFHTHGAPDNDGVVGPWLDGDFLPATLPDDPDATLADINAKYPAETQQKRDDLYYNVMSYHQEDRLLPTQMDKWTIAALGPRFPVLSRRTWFVAPGGSDTALGDSPSAPFATLYRGLQIASFSLGLPTDIISLSGATVTAPQTYINTPCTLRATAGPVKIVRP